MNEELEVKPVEAPTEQPAPAQQQSDREYNMRVLRERAENAERRAMELERMQQKAPAIENDIEDDMYVEGKHFKKYKSTLNDVQEELRSTKKQLEQYGNASAEMALRSKFSDFDSVVSDENMEKLAKAKPSLFRSIMHNPDLRDKGETAYDAIATFIQPTKYAAQDKKLEENKTKPRSSATVSPQASESPLARAEEYDRRTMSKERKEELYREMMTAAKRR